MFFLWDERACGGAYRGGFDHGTVRMALAWRDYSELKIPPASPKNHRPVPGVDLGMAGDTVEDTVVPVRAPMLCGPVDRPAPPAGKNHGRHEARHLKV